MGWTYVWGVDTVVNDVVEEAVQCCRVQGVRGGEALGVLWIG